MAIKKILTGVAGLSLAVLAGSVSAAYIETSASGSLFGDSYSYYFKIEEKAASGGKLFDATLTNTSSASLDQAQIDAFAFNMNPTLVLGTDFDIIAVIPDWSFEAATGAIKFDYVGTADNAAQNANRLGPNEILSFTFEFVEPQTYSLWLSSAQSLGQGFGGGNESGQVAVSFQQLGENGNDSDLLVSNWSEGGNGGGGGGGGGNVPEPATLALLGLGLVGLAASRRRRA